MQRFRYWIRDFFGFSRSETNGVLILLPLMALLIFSQPLYQKFLLNTEESYEEKKRNDFLDSLLANWDFNPAPPAKKKRTYRTFHFNPNTVSKDELESLGLAPYLAQRVHNYRLKGGQFKTPSDLLKIYGMDSLWYTRIASLVELPIAKSRVVRKKTPKKVYPKAKMRSFDLNTADSIQLKSIYGIGTVLAARIIKYRKILGGFVGKKQLSEIYGLDTSTIVAVTNNSFIATDFTPHQININASVKQLAQHPYIKYKLAKVIVAYRFQHGDFETVDDLLKIDLIDLEMLEKIKPYLKVSL